MTVEVDMYWMIGTSLTVLSGFLTGTVVLFRHIDKRFDKLESAQKGTEQKAEDLRTEVYREFLPRSEMNEIRRDIGKLFDRLDQMNGMLHKILGEHMARTGHHEG